MSVRIRTPHPYLAGLTVPLGGAAGLTVALTSGYRGSDEWVIWSCAAVALAAASGAAFVHGLRRWTELAALGDVPLSAVAWPLAMLYVISGAVLAVALRGDLVDAWRALVLILLAALGLAPGAATIVGVGHVASPRADPAPTPLGFEFGTLIAASRILQSLLAVMGGIVALLVIAEATGQRMTEHTNVETTLVFGASSSALVAIVYAPVAAKLRQRGRELVDLCHPLGTLAPNELAEALDKRSRLETTLGLDRTALSDFQTNVVVVGPLLAGAASAFLSR
ncbi:MULTISPECIES: hypothetical protein [unclassified Streptomyces]|uniref:hypothetical protein n=1 Tax=unclassified Streptomyces TaxID=2593676 RepID=UPI0038700710|nr:hypothetical protein OG569_41440 [Streptomyces sp. NBC_00827]